MKVIITGTDVRLEPENQTEVSDLKTLMQDVADEYKNKTSGNNVHIDDGYMQRENSDAVTISLKY